MSEKMDGVRAYWSGSKFYSRAGNEFFAPAWFTKTLPKQPLDGELWCGRGLFQKCVGFVKTKKVSGSKKIIQTKKKKP
jgi:DNA ligase-1